MMHVGGYHECRGDVQYRGGYHEYHGGYHDACGGIMSTVGVFSTVEGYYDACGGDILSTVGCLGPWVEFKKISRSEGFDSQKYRCSFLSITFFPCA